MSVTTGRLAGYVLMASGVAGLAWLAWPVAATAGDAADSTRVADDGLPKVSQAAKDALNKRYHDIVAKYQKAAVGEPDAWLALIEVFEAIQTAEKPIRDGTGKYRPDVTIPDFSAVFGGSESADNKGAAKAAIAMLAAYERAGVWTKLDAVADRQRCVRPAFDSADDRRLKRATARLEVEAWSGRMTEVMMPELGAMRQLARATAAHMHLAAQRKDWGTVAADYRRLLALSRVGTNDGVLLVGRVGIAIGELAHDRAAAAISAAGEGLPATLINGLDAALTDQTSHVPSFRLHIQAERLIAEDAVSQAFTKDGKPDLRWFNRMRQMVGDAPKQVDMNGQNAPEPRSTNAKLAEVFDTLEAWADAPWYSNQELDAKRSKLLGEITTQGKFGIVRIVAPNVSTSREIQLHSRASIAAMNGALDVYAFKTKTGALPKSLAAINEGAVALYMDPYSGKPLIYKPTPDGKGFELWAVGYDRADNGGKLKPGEPMIGFGPKGAGFDVRVWPREMK